jgi:hypothetical protein
MKKKSCTFARDIFRGFDYKPLRKGSKLVGINSWIWLTNLLFPEEGCGNSLCFPVSTQKSQGLEIHNGKNFKESHKRESHKVEVLAKIYSI